MSSSNKEEEEEEEETLRATIQSTITQFLNGPSEALRAGDPSLMLTMVTPECSHNLRPLRFFTAYPFLKTTKTNADQEEMMASVLPTMESTQNEVRDVVIDVANRRASVLSEHTTKIVGAEKSSTLEIAWFLDFTEDGKMIGKVVEFIDTATAAERIENMKKQGFGKE
ncbi:hypothetical protein GGS20DRAFT_569488 [Poronia punctata]|nr:hypothetical protein GGS20DRAFT_569488 [Poronia punctata]